ncbi:RNA binding (RRM/RBD/RNP motifs) family protein [Citrus sinensis]|uniref:RNA binding (RRM/RBD/RNP motifs) family protein n=1 Tax=Citrus sinensis TaxID=2711 RepID=A0ACB8JTJ9_CITSI|nr:RNA binding (RRM/RBD/RNP motifs) family protein [Citrus sinensis]
MSDKAEKTCPLCAEEMDLTDQQLKPCNCGYEICVWCWNHIMEMAEKDGTEGRCPACRTAYDKEKIVGMAANCERAVARMTSERRQKSQKAKPKASEGRMHLTNVRVIQRNLVYIIGLPINLADEDLLQRKEYFGQYGKVLKVSISRTATGAIQHSANNSCCVYITYSREDDAIRCIQSVHSYILDGRPLRACFGTTKYCHAWIRNMPCSVPDCLYLHDFGSQEDSFTKDEIVSAFTRSRVQQIIGATNNMHRRSGNALPPPADEYINSNITSTAKPIAKNSSNCSYNLIELVPFPQIIENPNNGSCADIVAGKSNSLPTAASWVMRVSATLPANKNLSGPVRPPSNQPKASNGPQVPGTEVVSTTISIQTVQPMEAVATSKVHHKLDPLELGKEYIDALSSTNEEATLDSIPATATSNQYITCRPTSKSSEKDIATPSSRTSSSESTKPFSSPGSVEDESSHIVMDFQGLCCGLSSIGLESQFEKDRSLPVVPNSSISKHVSVNLPGSHGPQEEKSGQFTECKSFQASMAAPTMEDSPDFDDLQFKGLEDMHHLPPISSTPHLPHNLNQSSYLSWQAGDVSNQSNLDGHSGNVPLEHKEVLPSRSENLISNGFITNEASSFFNLDATVQHSSLFSEVGFGSYLGKHDSTVAPLHSNASDVGESSIISKILSLDADAWEDSLTSPYSFAKLLRESNRQHDSLKMPSLFKESDCRQSRFSFARQEEFSNHASDVEHSLSNIRHSADQYPAPNGLLKNKDIFTDKHQNVFSSSSSMDSDNFLGSHSFISSSVHVYLFSFGSQTHVVMKPRCNHFIALYGTLQFVVSKAPTSVPPGFAVPNRAPPPGFSPHGTMQKPFDSSASHLRWTSAQAAGNSGPCGDIPFVDPAILEVGKGLQAIGLNNLGCDMRQTPSSQLNPFEHEARLQLLMQQSSSGYQNLRCWFCGDTPDSGPKRQQHMCLMVAVSKDKLSTFDSCILAGGLHLSQTGNVLLLVTKTVSNSRINYFACLFWEASCKLL